MLSCLATETEASIHIRQQKRLCHLKCTGVHLRCTAWSKQEHRCAGRMLFTHETRKRPFHTHEKSKQSVRVIENNNSPDSSCTEIDTCLDTSCLLVWLLKQQPASTSDSRRDFIISNVPGYIRIGLFGQNRNISVHYVPLPEVHWDRAGKPFEK
jgi:hypothetical protein